MASVRIILSGLLLLAAPDIAAARHESRTAWTLDVAHDDFAATTTCRLGSRDGVLSYRPGAVGIRVPRRRATTAAVYRIDGGAPVRWSDAYPALVDAGVAIDGPGLADPTGGIVWIPEAQLLGARSVAIRPDPRHRPFTVAVAGLAAQLDAARRQGCRFAIPPVR